MPCTRTLESNREYQGHRETKSVPLRLPTTILIGCHEQRLGGTIVRGQTLLCPGLTYRDHQLGCASGKKRRLDSSALLFQNSRGRSRAFAREKSCFYSSMTQDAAFQPTPPISRHDANYSVLFIFIAVWQPVLACQFSVKNPNSCTLVSKREVGQQIKARRRR